MKKILNITLALLLLLAGCEPMEDVYDELDEQKAPFNKSIEVALEEGAYATIADLIKRSDGATTEDSANADKIKNNQYFTDHYPASLYVPYLLEDQFKALKKDSRALVTFNYAPEATDLSHLELMHRLTDDDYASIDPALEDLGAFSPSYPASEHLTGIIEQQYPEAADNSVAYIDYRVSDIDPNQGGESPVIFREDFNGSLGTFSQVSVVGDDQVWEYRFYGDDQYAEMSGYDSGTRHDNDDYLISPAIDLSNNETASFKTRQVINYLDGVWENIQILVSTDYDGSGDIAAATWSEIALNTKPEGTNWDFVESEAYDLDEYIGQSSVYFAFRYRSQADPGVASTWRVDWMAIETSDAPKPEYTRYREYYQKVRGQWELVEEDDFNDNIYIVKEEDYDAMGNPGPGRYNNFSGSDHPNDYLPQLLSNKHLYAMEGDQVDVVYLYYSDGARTQASRYEFTEGTWVSTERVVKRSEQFVHNGDKWVFDPTVVFTMINDDYEYIVNYVRTQIENGTDYIDRDNEYYYGASSYYGNFDLRINKREDMGVPGYDAGTPLEEKIDLSYQRMTEAVELMLTFKFPDAVTQVNGVDVHYKVTVNTYENDLSRSDYLYEFKCVKGGPNPEFELISGPDLVE